MEDPHGKRSSAFYDWVAPFYDVFMKMGAFLDGIKASRARKNFVQSLGLEAESRVLEVGVGTGINLPLVARQVGPRGMIAGLDPSIPMLEQGQEKLARKNTAASLVGGQAERLPFKRDSFDTVYIFGAFNLLSDQERAVRELMRVTVPNGQIIISDKSLARFRKDSFRKNLLQTFEPQLSNPPPIDAIPLPEDEVELTWSWNNLFYVFKFRNPETAPAEPPTKSGVQATEKISITNS